MSDVSPGITFQDGDTCTSQSLHDLIENAGLSNITSGDLVTGTELIFVSASAPSATQWKYWYDNHELTGGLLRVWAEPFNLWLAVGPDRFEIPLQNRSGAMLHMGALVIAASSASSVGTATGPTLNAVGFLQATTASGAHGPVAVGGIGFVAFSTAATHITTIHFEKPFVTEWSPAGYISPLNVSAAPNVTTPAFGFFLETAVNRPDFAPTGLRALIWGPKIMTPPV